MQNWGFDQHEWEISSAAADHIGKKCYLTRKELYNLVGGLEHFLFFRFLIPTDFHIIQRGRYITNQ